jgi:hypothetical protein
MASILDAIQLEPSHTVGVYSSAQLPTADEWTFSDSLWLSLENMPLIGDSIKSIRGLPNTATTKLSTLYVKKIGLPNPSLGDLMAYAKLFLEIGAFLLALILVAVIIFYSYKFVKEFK